MPTIVTSCSKRKRITAPAELSAATLPPGQIDVVAREWERRIIDSTPVTEVRSLYSGRQFAEARKAARSLDAELLVVSAGLGVLRMDDFVPAYGLTVAKAGDDSVLSCIKGQAEAACWWREITSGSRRFRSLAHALHDAADNLVLISLPSAYLSMIADEISTFDLSLLNRVRVFTGPSFRFGDERLDRLVLPYDNRLDGPESPCPGTATDFPGRALADFAANILPALPDADVSEHSAAVSRRISRWTTRRRPVRLRQNDAELLDVIRCHWAIAGASASQMLRFMRRELGLACEQGRMRDLWAEVREEMEGHR